MSFDYALVMELWVRRLTRRALKMTSMSMPSCKDEASSGTQAAFDRAGAHLPSQLGEATASRAAGETSR